MAKLTFLGAVGEVTGSRYLVESDAGKVLLECGLVQGGAQAERRNHLSLKQLARTVDAVVLSHAHLDHSGLIPKLVRDGYRGPVHCTEGTAELLAIMWRDAAHVMARDIEWENKWRERAGRPLVEPVYDIDDAERALTLRRPANYGEPVVVNDDLTVVFRDAGHILGSAIVEMTVRAARRSRVVFSGDLGNPDSVLMKAPEAVESADVVLMESTYGNRDHRPLGETLEELAGILKEAHQGGGNVLIPAFAVGRTQEILFHLAMLHQEGRLPQRYIFLDSPMAIGVTELYHRCRELLNPEDLARLPHGGKGDPMKLLPGLQLSRSAEESMAINRVAGGAIIIAGSGMCTGGRIRHHLKYNLWRPNTHVIIAGFQARGTLGRKLVDGVKKVKLLGVEVAVKATVHTLGGLSAHAGQSQLVAWAARFRNHPRFYLVHGEPEAQEELRETLRRDLEAEVEIPRPGDTVELG